ncbi:hypothetical protein BGZ82_002121 [Podila clonocystis]|nr:hypothetical protein BGZ82_002121 [Podila clonocystis]
MGRYRKNTTNSGDSIQGSPTKGALPHVRDISWVRSPDLNEKKVDIGDEVESGSVTRVQVLYKYDGGKRPLVVTQPNHGEAFFRTNGVEEDSYIVPKTGVKTMLGRNVMKIYMDEDNKHHREFHDSLIRVRNAVKKKLEKDKGSKANVQIKGLYDLVDDEGTVTGHALVTRLIESRDGDMYTAAYDEEKQVDIMEVGRSIVRPALVFQYTLPDEENGEYRISVSVTQVYVKSQSLFPLRDRD